MQAFGLKWVRHSLIVQSVTTYWT